MSRVQAHVTETLSRVIFQYIVTNFSNEEVRKGDLLFREVTEKDYGIDGVVELFYSGEPTGRFAWIQLKGTDSVIEKLKGSDEVSCSGVSKSNLCYCRQNNVPVMLVYVSNVDRNFYYIDLQSIFSESRYTDEEIPDSVTVRIPIENNSSDLSLLVQMINDYYDNREMYDEWEVGKSKFEDEMEDLFEPKTSESVGLYDRVADGMHKQVNSSGEVLKNGYWKNDRLEKGTEYDWLIFVTEGSLIFKPDCPDDPYDATEDFTYEKFEQYGQSVLCRFLMSRTYLEYENIEKFYVVDMEVDGDMEQMVNIRTLREFLENRNPELLDEICTE